MAVFLITAELCKHFQTCCFKIYYCIFIYLIIVNKFRLPKRILFLASKSRKLKFLNQRLIPKNYEFKN